MEDLMQHSLKSQGIGEQRLFQVADRWPKKVDFEYEKEQNEVILTQQIHIHLMKIVEDLWKQQFRLKV